MKKYLRSYHAFLPGKYMQWIIYLLYPVALLALYILGGFLFGRVAIVMVMPFAMLGAECMIDMFVFGGFAAKGNAGRIEYLMASVKGSKLVNYALAVDWIRRLLYLAVMAAVVVIACWVEQGSDMDLMLMKIFFCLVSASGFLMGIALWVIRLLDNRTAQIGAMYIALNLPVWMVFLIFRRFAVNLNWICIICILGCVMSAAGQVWYLMKKVKEGYYDK